MIREHPLSILFACTYSIETRWVFQKRDTIPGCNFREEDGKDREIERSSDREIERLKDRDNRKNKEREKRVNLNNTPEASSQDEMILPLNRTRSPKTFQESLVLSLPSSAVLAASSQPLPRPAQVWPGLGILSQAIHRGRTTMIRWLAGWLLVILERAGGRLARRAWTTSFVKRDAK